MTFYELILKRSKDNQNRFLFIVLFFLLLVIFVAVTMITFVLDFKKINLDKNILTRTFLVEKQNDDANYDSISQIDHVDFHVSDKFLNCVGSKVAIFDKENLNGYLEFLPLIRTDDVEIIDGSNLQNPGDVICPTKFYPHDIVIIDKKNNNFSSRMIKSNILSGKDVIGKTFTISHYDVEEDKDKSLNLKIVGTYDASKALTTLNTCYISLEDFDNYAFSYNGYTEGSDINGNIISRDFNYYTSEIVRVDSYDNIKYVKNELNKLGFSVYPVYQFAEEYLMLILYIPLMIAIIAIIVSCGIIYNFLNKKLYERHNFYGMLSAFGYQQKEIIKIEFIESFIILVKAFITSLIIYFGLYFIINELMLTEFSYNNIIVNIPILLFFVIFIFIMGIIYFINTKALKKILSNDIIVLLKEE